MKLYLVFLTILSILFAIFEYFKNKFIKLNVKENNIGLLLTLILHYLVYFFIHLTLIFILIPNYFSNWFIQLYLFFQILVLISWLIFDNKCILTVFTNRLMKISDDFAFRDPFKILQNKYEKIKSFDDKLDYNDKFQYFFMISSIVISIYVILLKK